MATCKCPFPGPTLSGGSYSHWCFLVPPIVFCAHKLVPSEYLLSYHMRPNGQAIPCISLYHLLPSRPSQVLHLHAVPCLPLCTAAPSFRPSMAHSVSIHGKTTPGSNIHFCSTRLPTTRASWRSCQPWGRVSALTLTMKTSLLAHVCLSHDACAWLRASEGFLDVGFLTFVLGTLCGTRRDSRPYSVRFICDVCNTVH